MGRSFPALALAFLSLVFLITPASAQVTSSGFGARTDTPLLEVEGGGGYVFGRGLEDPGPSLPTYDLGVVVWPLRSLGFAIRLVRGPGNDFHTPHEAGDRTFYGEEHLAYTTYTVRYRGLLAPKMFLELGAGLMTNGHYSDQEFLYRTQTYIHPESHFSGLALEALVSRRLTRFFGLKAGFTIDFNVETNNYQPVALGTVGF